MNSDEPVTVTNCETALVFMPFVRVRRKKPYAFKVIVSHVYRGTGIDTELYGEGDTELAAFEAVAQEVTDWVQCVLTSSAHATPENHNVVFHAGDPEALCHGADGIITVTLLEQSPREAWSCDIDINLFTDRSN